MKNSDLGQKIRNLRNRMGISQDQLAEQTRLSLRTIQRIENGASEARGDSLNRLAKALDISTTHLFEQTEQEDKSFLAFVNLSALSFILLPFLGIILPLALWIWKRDKIRLLNETGKRLLNFQITWFIAICLIYLSLIGFLILKIEAIMPFGRTESAIFSIYGLYALNFILIIVNTIRSLKAKNVVYQPAIPFLR